MGLGETDLLEDQAADEISVSAQTISCSICLEAVSDCGNRSKAKLQCGHEFHLDCIGSAFNAKGLMQCPNCRKIEKGQWLYANGYCSFPEFTVEDWTHDEDIYDLGYSEMPFGVHWCPFTGISRLPLSFEEGEPPSTEFPDLLGPQAIFTEYMTASSPGHSGPYVAYLQPVQPSSSASSTESVVDGPFHHHWSSISGLSDIPSSHVFAATDIHYQSWEHHSPPFSPPNSRISAADQTPSTTLRSARPDSDGLPRTGSLGHPFLLGHGSGLRAGNSAVSTVPTYLGNPQTHSRIHGPHAYNQHNSPGVHAPVFSGPRRSNSSRGVPSSSDHSSYYLFPSASSGRSLQDAENSAGSNLYAWERDCFAPYPLPPLERESTWWGPFHQNAGRSNSSSRNNSWHRHGLERSSSQARTENASHPSIHLNQMHPYL